MVVGLDGSASSRAALHWAIQYATATRRPVHAVAVWHQEPFAEERPLPKEEFEAEAKRWVMDALDDLEPDEERADIHTHLDEGDPVNVLLTESREAEVLVLGNHRHSRLHDAMVGSVAVECARKAPCTVVLVPKPRGAGEPG